MESLSKITHILPSLNFPSIYLVTWNVHGKPPPASFSNLLQLDALPLPDIYAIGIQEAASNIWEAALISALKPFQYVKIKSRQLVGIITIMFVKRSILPYVTSVESELTKTGLGGFYGNKGACSIRADIMGMNLIVVNCHLAAHMENVVERMNNIDQILATQKFKDQDTDNILDHDYIFWMGDMNFRIERSYNRVLELINEKQYERLYESDQLHIAIEEGLIFENFLEGRLTFPPTYKFDPGTDTYDTSPKCRVPAYTDRILYYYHNATYGKTQLEAKLVQYRSHPLYKTSDHKPVSALLEFKTLPRGVQSLISFRFNTLAWYREKDQVVTYFVRKDFKVAYGDWIGLYKEDFTDFDSFVTYVWAKTADTSNSLVPVSVHFPSSQLVPLTPGKYLICYLTRKNSLCGISSPFNIIQ
ncbi:unnamed protein product [Lymnaea stagnalis]|uniref:Inositol polyphosphate-related phosphatase domain-containing protein n=1 Tax=Lymnaea stagnalis TaxID=6523 RepID=A0AAV2H6U0_LYMST